MQQTRDRKGYQTQAEKGKMYTAGARQHVKEISMDCPEVQISSSHLNLGALSDKS